MTNSEIIDSQSSIQMENYKPQTSSPGILSFLRILEYISLATAIGSGITIYLFLDDVKLFISLVVSISLFVFFFLLNRELQSNHTNTVKDTNLIKKAILYGNVSQLHNSPENIQITQAVEKALRYSQELIDDYKKIQTTSQKYILYFAVRHNSFFWCYTDFSSC